MVGTAGRGFIVPGACDSRAHCPRFDRPFVAEPAFLDDAEHDLMVQLLDRLGCGLSDLGFRDLQSARVRVAVDVAGDLCASAAVFEQVVDEAPGGFGVDECSASCSVSADSQDPVGCFWSDAEKLP